MPQKRRQKEHADVSGKGSSASSGNSGYSASELLTISVTESAVSVIFNRIALKRHPSENASIRMKRHSG